MARVSTWFKWITLHEGLRIYLFGKNLKKTMAIAPNIRNRTFLDYYYECGPSANFIALSCILFLWIAFICCLQRADRNRSNYVNLLLPSSLLPIVIGIFGSSHALYQGLNFMYHRSQGSDAVMHPEELVIALIAGSFLSGIFIFFTVVILFINSNRNSRIPPKETEQGVTPQSATRSGFDFPA